MHLNTVLCSLLQELDWSTALPHAKDVEPPRGIYSAILYGCTHPTLFLPHPSLSCIEHIDASTPWFGPNTYRAISIGMLILLAVGILAIVGGVAFVQAQGKRKKHFF